MITAYLIKNLNLILVLSFLLGVTHRDLKLENILLSENNEPIVTDFGFARYIGMDEDQRTRSRTFCGSYAYVAPEILQGNSNIQILLADLINVICPQKNRVCRMTNISEKMCSVYLFI